MFIQPLDDAPKVVYSFDCGLGFDVESISPYPNRITGDQIRSAIIDRMMNMSNQELIDTVLPSYASRAINPDDY